MRSAGTFHSRERHQDARIGSRTWFGSTGSRTRNRSLVSASRPRSGVRQDRDDMAPPASRPAGSPNPRGRVVRRSLQVWPVSHDNPMPAVLCLMLRPPRCTVGRWMPERPCACAEEVAMAGPSEPQAETYNPWSIVNLVFHHLADQGLHPILGESRDPGEPAAALLRALGIEPAAEGNRQVITTIWLHLDQIRSAVLGEPGDG